MEIWFLAAVGGALFAGLSNFYFKQAAVRGYNAELFSLYGGLISIVIIGTIVFLQQESLFYYGWLAGLTFLGGLLGAQNNILKVLALRFIDSTIYFPLFKLLAPALAIIAGIIFFGESFTSIEWLGMILGLSVPLLLITRAEHSRQQNLIAGLLVVLITGILSAAAAVINKFATDAGVPILVILISVSFGVFIGTLLTLTIRKGIQNLLNTIKKETSLGLIIGASLRSIFISIGLGLMLYAFTAGGTLAIVQTIHSMYILIPIVLAIILYNEHWNLQKVIAIILSIAALGLLQ